MTERVQPDQAYGALTLLRQFAGDSEPCRQSFDVLATFIKETSRAQASPIPAVMELVGAAIAGDVREFIQRIVWYFDGESFENQLIAARGAPLDEVHPQYVDEKRADFERGFVIWWSRFDPERQLRWLKAAISYKPARFAMGGEIDVDPG